MVTLIEWTAIVSAVAGISAAMLILIQLWHMDKHRDLEISIKLFEWAETGRLRKAFKWVETEFQFVDYEKYKAELERNSEVGDFPHQVEAFFEEVGFLVNKKFVEVDVIVDRLGSDIVFNWKKLEPWILALRKETGDRTFGEHFQKLSENSRFSKKKC
jgi:hypothetical protein